MRANKNATIKGPPRFLASLVWRAPDHRAGGMRARARREFALPLALRKRMSTSLLDSVFEHLLVLLIGPSHAVTKAESKHFVFHVSRLEI